MTPEELENLPKPLERTMTALEEFIMEEIIERLRETLEVTPTIDFLIQRLSAIGVSKNRIKQLIEEALKEAEKQVDDIYQKAVDTDYVRNKELYQSVGKDYLPYNENPWLQQVVEAFRQQTKDSLRPMENITQTTGFNVSIGGGKKTFTPLSEYFERSLDKAMLGIASGAKTYSQAIGDVIDEMTASGIRVVDYASGKSDRVEVAARRAVMTGVAQVTDKVNEKNMQELDTDYCEVDWHMGARNTGTGYQNHQSWQGRVYSSEQMRTVCGKGEMLGFGGINCYHVAFAFIPGVSKRKYTDEWLEEQNRKENEKKVFKGKEYDTYAALQYQRKLERTIRKQKQDVRLLEKAGADKEDITAAKCRLQLTNKTYVGFSKEMGLRQQRERLTIPKSVEKTNTSDIIKAGAISGARNPYGVAAEEHAKRYYGLVRKMTTDVKKIASVTGYSEAEIQRIKNYIFTDEHDLGERGIGRFDPDYMMGESWRRLMEGIPEQHDLTMLQHEIMEQSLIDQGYSQEEAHIKASAKYNYGKEAVEFYGKIKKFKKE